MKSKSRANTTNSIRKKESPQKPLLYTSNSTSGQGLWCYPPINKENHSEPVKLPTLNKVDAKIENSVIQMLENECENLGKAFENEKALNQSLNVKLLYFSNEVIKKENALVEKNKELSEISRQLEESQNHNENLKELYNTQLRDLNKALHELETCKNELLSLKSNNINDKNENRKVMNNKKEIELRMEEIDEINEDLKYKLQESESFIAKLKIEHKRELEEMKLKFQKDIETKSERNAKLLEENYTLSQKLSESDNYKKLFKSKLESQEKEISSLQTERNGLQELIKSQKKRIKDLEISKNEAKKVYQSKLKVIESQNNYSTDGTFKTTKKNEFQNEKKDEREELLPVKAKPLLFGNSM